MQGSVGIDINPPALYGSRSYLPADGTLLLLIGYDPAAHLLVPVGVGRLDSGLIRSVRKVALRSLGYIGIGFVRAGDQALLQSFVDQQIDLPRLIQALER